MDKYGQKNVVCVPIEALSSGDEMEPEVGDTVEFTGIGSIVKVMEDDGILHIKVENIGGEDVVEYKDSDKKSGGEEMSDDEMEKYLRRSAKLEAGEEN